MNGSSSTTSSFSPLASVPRSTSLTAPLSPLGPHADPTGPRQPRLPTDRRMPCTGSSAATVRQLTVLPRPARAALGCLLAARGTMGASRRDRERGTRDAGVGNLPGRDGRHAPGPAARGHPRPRADDPREARDAQPRRLGQGPDRDPDDRGRRAARPARPGRHDRRADLGQHRPRPRDRRRDPRVPLHLRDARQDERGEDRAAARLRGRGRDHPDRRRAESPRSPTTRSRTGSRARSPAPSSRTSTSTRSTPRRTS